MAHCPAYSGSICSLCCSLETRCRDCASRRRGCRTRCSPGSASRCRRAWCGFDHRRSAAISACWRCSSASSARVLSLVYFLIALDLEGPRDILASTLWTVFFILIFIAGVAAWLFVLAQESRRVAEEETRRQTDLLMNEIEAHKRTDALLQKAKEAAEAANKAKSRHVVGLSHELRTPLNAILGYAQLMERDPAIPPQRVNAIKVVRRSAEHLSGLIDGLLDISKIEAGHLHLTRNEVHISRFPRRDRQHGPPAGDRQGHRLPLSCALDRPAGRGADRREPAAPDPDQSSLQRHQVHRCRRGDVPGRLSPSGRRVHHRRHRRRHPQERSGAHLPAVRARPHRRRQGDHRHRARAHHHQPAHQDHGRRHFGEERGRQGHDLPGQALPLGGAAPAHRLDHGIPRTRL